MGKISNNNNLKMDIPIWRKLVFFNYQKRKKEKKCT